MALKRWIGAADAVAQVTTITFSAYTSGETYTLTINDKDVTYTAAASTNTDVWNGLQAAWEGSDVPEHVEAIATVDSGVVLTSRTEGQPFTVSASATGGITSTVTATTAATGPNFFDDDANWEDGSAPSGSDDLLFADSDVDLLYNIEPALAFGDVTVERSFTGRIGLARTSDNGYNEYRDRYLKFASAVVLEIGTGSGNGSNRLLFDCNNQDMTVDIFHSGSGESEAEAPIQILDSSTSSTIGVYGGEVSLESTTTSRGCASLVVVSPDTADVSATVSVDEDLTIGTVTVSGSQANLKHYGAATSVTVESGAVFECLRAATCPTVTVADGGVCYWDSSSNLSTDLFVYSGGTCSFNRRKETRTVADAELHAQGTILDRFATVTWTDGVEVVGLIADVTLDLGRNRTLTPS